MTTKKPKNTAYTLLGKIGDILLFPIVIVALCVSLLIMFQAKSDTIPSVFGISIVRILSGSMVKSGFNIGDNVIIKKTDTNTLWKDDIIAFFQKEDPADAGRILTKLDNIDDEPNITKPIPEKTTKIVPKIWLANIDTIPPNVNITAKNNSKNNVFFI